MSPELHTLLEVVLHIRSKHNSQVDPYLKRVLGSEERPINILQGIDAHFPSFAPQSAGTAQARSTATVTAVNTVIPLLLRLHNTSRIPADQLTSGLGSPLSPFESKVGSTDHALLGDLFTLYGSDKAITHGYNDLYSALFANRFVVERVFEIGLGTNNVDVLSTMGPTGRPGASQRAFRDFFPSAYITGADIDKRVLFEEDRIDTVYLDQTDLSSFPSSYASETFDLMIDDGLHAPHANLCSLTYFLPLIKVGGFAVIEDIGAAALSIWQLASILLGERYRPTLFKSPKSGALVFVVQRTF
jgi:hypothetical protein